MNTNERDQLQDELVKGILECMGTEELVELARQKLHDLYFQYSDEALLTVAEDYGIEVDIPEDVEL